MKKNITKKPPPKHKEQQIKNGLSKKRVAGNMEKS